MAGFIYNFLFNNVYKTNILITNDNIWINPLILLRKRYCIWFHFNSVKLFKSRWTLIKLRHFNKQFLISFFILLIYILYAFFH